ncbi:hypothetical protein WICPIJ_007121 [Wickerhamomyces pijperi]|uniref:Uncharacterized protein n=1 Tax=Wickerhamomyces pijperi TaxID=599730 RepID=A0A9P8Q287_WICPI|nr:hypothetical protein WICPIJ_007121 [Wickerhamomyces pijperi]
MYSPSPTTVTKRPFGECLSEVGKTSTEPKSLEGNGNGSPSSASSEPLMTEEKTSEFLDQINLPTGSIERRGSSLPNCKTAIPASKPTARELELLLAARHQALSKP